MVGAGLGSGRASGFKGSGGREGGTGGSVLAYGRLDIGWGGDAQVLLAVDPSRFHFFDPASGSALPLRGVQQIDPTPVTA